MNFGCVLLNSSNFAALSPRNVAPMCSQNFEELSAKLPIILWDFEEFQYNSTDFWRNPTQISHRFPRSSTNPKNFCEWKQTSPPPPPSPTHDHALNFLWSLNNLKRISQEPSSNSSNLKHFEPFRETLTILLEVNALRRTFGKSRAVSSSSIISE